MSRIMLLLALAAATPAAAAERTFIVTDFDRVQIEGPFEVTLATGRPSRAIARGDNRALDRVDIDVQGRLLKIRRNISAWGGNPGEQAGPVTIELGTRLLRSAVVRGGGSLGVDRAEGLRIELSLTGNGRIAVETLASDNVDVALIGSGRIQLGGEAKSFRAAVDGAGDLDAADLIVDDAQINAGTAGKVTLAVTRTAKVNATGSGDVEITGSPACTVTTRGAGRVTCGDGR